MKPIIRTKVIMMIVKKTLNILILMKIFKFLIAVKLYTMANTMKHVYVYENYLKLIDLSVISLSYPLPASITAKMTG